MIFKVSFLSHSCQILFGVLLGSFFVLDARLQGSTLKRLQHKLDFFSLEGPDLLFPDKFAPLGFEKIHEHNTLAGFPLCSSVLKGMRKDKWCTFRRYFCYKTNIFNTRILLLKVIISCSRSTERLCRTDGEAQPKSECNRKKNKIK